MLIPGLNPKKAPTRRRNPWSSCNRPPPCAADRIDRQDQGQATNVPTKDGKEAAAPL